MLGGAIKSEADEGGRCPAAVSAIKPNATADRDQNRAPPGRPATERGVGAGRVIVVSDEQLGSEPDPGERRECGHDIHDDEG